MARLALHRGLPPWLCGLCRDLRGRVGPMDVEGPPPRIRLQGTSRLPSPYVSKKQTRGKGNEPASSPNNSEGGIGSPLPGGRCCSPEGVRVCVHQSLK